MVLKQQGVCGGPQPPSFANEMIRAACLSCKHGDDMMLFYCEHGWPKELKRLQERRPRQLRGYHNVCWPWSAERSSAVNYSVCWSWNISNAASQSTSKGPKDHRTRGPPLDQRTKPLPKKKAGPPTICALKIMLSIKQKPESI